MKNLFRSFLKFISSLRLTVVILSALIICSIPATLIMQNQNQLFYLQNYPGSLGALILKLGLNHYFSSVLFLFLIALFWINLLSCTVKRFSLQLKRGVKGRYGPDVLHLGLLLLIAASLLSFMTRQEGSIFLAAGDSMILPSGRFMNVEEFIFEQYADGRPKSWITRVNISNSPDERGEVIEIAVNKPLRIDSLVLYQASYRPSTTVGVYNSGLMVTSDPARIYILISFFIIICGLILTFAQPRRGRGVSHDS